MAKVEGLRDLKRRLDALEQAAAGKALRGATRYAMVPVRDAAIQNAPVGVREHKTYKGRIVFPGFLSRSVKLRSKLSRDKNTAWAEVGVKHEAFYGVHFLEYGTSRIARRPWLRPAMDNNQHQAQQRLKERLKHLIDKARRK